MTVDRFELSAASLKKIEELKGQFPKNEQRSLIVPALWIIQKEYGYIPPEAIPYLAGLLKVPEIMVKEPLSWYSMFRTKKPGKYHIHVCRNLSCSLREGEEILQYLRQKLGVDLEETTPDGKFTLSTVECLASCGTAPVIQINEDYYENISKERIDHILANLP